MTNNKIIKEYAKNKLLAEQAQNRCKELQPLLYDIMTAEGEQTIGKKTYTIENNNYIIAMTEANSALVVDWKAYVLEALGMTEKQAKQELIQQGYFTTRNGAITFKVESKED